MFARKCNDLYSGYLTAFLVYSVASGIICKTLLCLVSTHVYLSIYITQRFSGCVFKGGKTGGPQQQPSTESDFHNFSMSLEGNCG